MPGFARASATNSGTVFAGTDGWTIIANGIDATSDTGVKSLTGSNGSFGLSAGLIACELTVPIMIA